MNKDARCIFLCGMRGSGKSTLVQSLMAGSVRVVAFDPLGEYGRPVSRQGRGWPLVSSLVELHRFAGAHWRAPGWRVAFTPAGDFVEELHRLSVYLWNAMAPYESGRDKKMLLLIVEEMDLSVPNHRLAKGLEGFKQVALQGRHRGLEVIGVTQHPALVPKWFRINSLERYVLPIGFEDHAIMGPRYRDQIASLRKHQWLRFRAGELEPTRGENRLISGPAPRPRPRGP